MIKLIKIVLCFLTLFSIEPSIAQSTRINDDNSIGWYSLFANKKISEKWNGHFEYQWRRDNTISKPMQSLLRVGINYEVHPKVTLRAGYAWIETYAYGSIPIQSAGKTFTEHRTFLAAIIKDNIGIVELQHRFMLEQRWVGRYTNANLEKEDDYVFLNRMRYLMRLQLPIGKKKIEDKTLYAALYDEVFIQFGKEVQENIFDQNRLGALLGYKWNKSFRIEGGVLFQTLQLGREIGGRNVMQYNKGIVLNTYVNF